MSLEIPAAEVAAPKVAAAEVAAACVASEIAARASAAAPVAGTGVITASRVHACVAAVGARGSAAEELVVHPHAGRRAEHAAQKTGEEATTAAGTRTSAAGTTAARKRTDQANDQPGAEQHTHTDAQPFANPAGTIALPRLLIGMLDGLAQVLARIICGSIKALVRGSSALSVRLGLGRLTHRGLKMFAQCRSLRIPKAV